MTHISLLVTRIKSYVLTVKGLLGLIAFVTLLFLPLLTESPYLLLVFATANIFAVLAASWDFFSDLTGYLSLGHALFFGIAAYTMGFLSRDYLFPSWATIPIGGAMAMVAALGIGFLTLRLKGPFFALLTLPFPLIAVSITLYAFPLVFGGEHGIYGIGSLSPNLIIDYYVVLIYTAIVILILYTLSTSNFGLILRSSRRTKSP